MLSITSMLTSFIATFGSPQFQALSLMFVTGFETIVTIARDSPLLASVELRLPKAELTPVVG